jgi:hypothetical protein
MKSWRNLIAGSFTAMILICSSSLSAQPQAPIEIVDQGSFAVGGSITVAPGTFDPRKPLDPAGQSYHGDHAYAFYQIPSHAHHLPIVMWHGAGQSSRSWQTTPDGREGFQTIFLRRHYATYLVDQPRRGEAGRSMVESTLADTGRAAMVQSVPGRRVAGLFSGRSVRP